MTVSRPLKMGIVGLGQGAASMLATMGSLSEITLVAAMARNPQAREAFLKRYAGARAYPDIAGLCRDPEVEAVCIATPNQLHADHAIEVMQHGKHVVVEKPMAVTMEQADRMVAAAATYGVKLLAGFTDSLSLPIRAMRKVVQSGELGVAKAIFNWSFTDWMLRPRTEQELSPEAGWGVIHRQAPHQIDALRLLGGGLLRSVRGSVGQWMPERSGVPGYYAAQLEFEDGLPATIVYNGYGYFMTLDVYPGLERFHKYTDTDRVAIRRAMRSGTRDEQGAKDAIKVGGSAEPAVGHGAGAANDPWTPMDLGMFVLSCERGDVQPSPLGITIAGDAGRREIDLHPLARGERLDRGDHEAFRELHAAVVEGKPLFHTGEWGRATLEATIAIFESARDRREIRLRHQVSMSPDYDRELVLPEGC